MSSHIEYQRFRHGDSCSEEGCRARKFYIEDGKKFCQRGHEQFGFTQTQQDEDDWNAQGKKSRKKRVVKERIETVLTGKEARELYLQSYQLLLRKQLFWLINTKKFPPELEAIVRDLWDLRTRDVRTLQETRSGYSSATGTTMMYSSQSEGVTDYETDGTDGRSMTSRRSRKDAASQEKLPKLVETLGLCYLGILLLQLPLSLGDFYKWVTQDEIVYSRAIKEIPKEMRAALPPSYHNALQVATPLKEAVLHQKTFELAQFFFIQHEMILPPLNKTLLLVKHICDLGLPIEIFSIVKNLARLLDLSFSYSFNGPRGHGVLSYPEIRLISLVIVATKLLYPFDNIERIPYGDSDPTITKLDWNQWSRVMAEEKPSGLARGTEMNVRESDVWNMNDEKMDNYLDWYQRSWIDDRDLKMPSQILDLFPLQPIDLAPAIPSATETTIKKLKAVHSSLIIQSPVQQTEDTEMGTNRIIRPGEKFTRYRKIEELPLIAKSFYKKAAGNAGASLNMVVKGVFLLELQLETWMDREKRKIAFGRDESLERDD